MFSDHILSLESNWKGVDATAEHGDEEVTDEQTQDTPGEEAPLGWKLGNVKLIKSIDRIEKQLQIGKTNVD